MTAFSWCRRLLFSGSSLNCLRAVFLFLFFRWIFVNALICCFIRCLCMTVFSRCRLLFLGGWLDLLHALCLICHFSVRFFWKFRVHLFCKFANANFDVLDCLFRFYYDGCELNRNAPMGVRGNLSSELSLVSVTLFVPSNSWETQNNGFLSNWIFFFVGHLPPLFVSDPDSWKCNYELNLSCG